MRVWAVSDIHTDYAENLDWCKNLSETEYKDDALLLAGDVTDNLDLLTTTLECLASKWKLVFYVPGNHDLWVRRGEREQYDSLGKLERVQEVCRQAGVAWRPACVEGVWLVPLLSWYHASWDREPDIPGAPPVNKVMVDFHACRWPRPDLNAEDTSLAQLFDSMNDAATSAVEEDLRCADGGAASRLPVITFSHYLPVQALLPEKRMLFQPNLAKASGSDFLAERIRRLSPLAHVFGHTHFSWDAAIDGTRYVQWPLAYPHERRQREHGGQGWEPLMLFDTKTGLSQSRQTYWSNYYSCNARNPSNITPAPWVAQHLRIK